MASLETVPENLHKALRRELEHGERVVWHAQPVPRLYVWKAKKLLWFAVPWLGISVAIGYAFIEKADPLGFGFMVVFAFIGLCLLLAPLTMFSEARRTLYVVTDRRAIIFQKSKKLKIRSVYPRQFREISKTLHANGSGDVLFAGIEEFGDANQRYIGLEGFEAVQDATDAERALRALVVGGEA